MIQINIFVNNDEYEISRFINQKSILNTASDTSITATLEHIVLKNSCFKFSFQTFTSGIFYHCDSAYISILIISRENSYNSFMMNNC